MGEIFILNDFCHFFCGSEAIIIDADDGDNFGDFVDKSFVVSIEIFEEIQADIGFAIATSHFDTFEGAFRFDVEVDDDVRFTHEIAHISEELNVSFVIAIVHQAGFCEHGSEDGILVYGTILNGGFPAPDNFLMLLESSGEEVDLHGEGVFFHVVIIIDEILVIFDGFVVGFNSEMIGERCCERRFSGADHAGDANEKIFHDNPYSSDEFDKHRYRLRFGWYSAEGKN